MRYFAAPLILLFAMVWVADGPLAQTQRQQIRPAPRTQPAPQAQPATPPQQTQQIRPSRTPTAQRTLLAADCRDTLVDGKIECDIRLSDTTAIRRVTVQRGAAVEAGEVTYEPFDNTGGTAAWYILVDRGNRTGRQATVTRIGQVVASLVDQTGANDRLGLAMIGDKLEVLAPLGSARPKLRLASSPGRIVVGTAADTQLYRLAIEAIGQLRDFPADRKALVLFTDGRNSGDTTVDAVVNAARDADITIYSIAYPESADADLADLRRLASDTSGPYIAADASNKNLPDNFVQDFTKYLKSGGRIRFDPISADEGVQYTISAELENNRNVTTDVAIDVQGEGIVGIPGDYIQVLRDFYEQNRIAVIAGGAVAALLLIAVIVLILRRVMRAPAPGPAAVAVAKVEGKAKKTTLAWLEYVDSGKQRIPIMEGTVSIGRHSDNDIRIEDSSEQSTVHRRHATIHLTPEKEFIITDLSGKTGNGVIVNSQRVDRRKLNNGDLIELGLVKLRFEIAGQ